MSRFYSFFVLAFLLTSSVRAENFIPVGDDPWWTTTKGGLSVDTGGRSRFVPIDLDGDGLLDLVSGDETGALHFFQNQGSFSFIEVKDYFSYIDYSDTTTPSFYDADGDGVYEVMALGVKDYIYFYRLNTTTGQYEIDSSYELSFSAGIQLAPFLVDWDDDGNLDMIVGQKVTGVIKHFEDNGSGWTDLGTLLNTGETGSAKNKVLNVPFIIDFNDDGHDDIFVGKNDGTVHYYENQHATTGSDSFVEVTSVFASSLDLGDISAVSLGDMTGDGLPDLIVGSQEGHLSVFENSGGVFGSTDLVDDGSIEVGNRSIAFAIKSGDELDLYVGNQNGTLDLFTYDILTSLLTSSTKNYLGLDFGDNSSVKLGDVTTSSGNEFIVGSKIGTVLIVSEDGTSTTTLDDIGDFSTPYPYDIDDDGNIDFIAGERQGGLFLFLNTGSGAFSTPVPFLSIDVGERSVPAFGDIDGDGDDDLLIGDKNGTLTLLRNNGSATMADDANYDIETGYAAIDVGDLSAPTLIDVNDDGAKDMIVGSAFGRLFLFLQDADGDGVVGDEDCNSSDPFTYTGATEACDGVDNDCDGTIDGALACDDESGFCEDGVDNDGDGFLDSEDSDCGGLETSCLDGLDNDGDGAVDCDDIDCASDSSCLTVFEDCTNGLDDNSNGLIDCEDSDCTDDASCTASSTGESVSSDGSDTSSGETSSGSTTSGDTSSGETSSGETSSTAGSETGSTTGADVGILPSDGGDSGVDGSESESDDSPDGYSLIRGTGCSLNFN